jgi:hypothetical protein
MRRDAFDNRFDRVLDGSDVLLCGLVKIYNNRFRKMRSHYTKEHAYHEQRCWPKDQVQTMWRTGPRFRLPRRLVADPIDLAWHRSEAGKIFPVRWQTRRDAERDQRFRVGPGTNSSLSESQTRREAS